MAEQNIYVVKAGDTLSEIAQKFGIGNGNWMKGAEILGDINNIENIDYIVVGQRIKLYGSKETVAENNQYVTIKAFGLQSGSQRGMYVSWAWSRSNTECFEVTWQYLADGSWCNGTNTTINIDQLKHSIYTAPDNAKSVRAYVLPVAKKQKRNAGEVPYWTAKSKYAGVYSFADNPPEAPSAPNIDDSRLKDLILTASLSNLDPEWESQKVEIEFQLVRNNSKTVTTTDSGIKTGYASASWKAPQITAGNQYKVRCRAKKVVDEDTLYSPWSAYTNNFSTKPEGTTSITKCQASKAADGSNDICVYLEWTPINTAESYTVQYATDESDFEYNAATESTGIETTKFKTPALEGGKYYFRVRGSNANGDTEWSDVAEVTVGDVPAAPTTWSSASSVVAGTPITLYWIHNARDNSDETFAELEVYINDVKQAIPTIENTDINTTEDGISSYVLNTEGNDEGVVIRWRVQTAGVTLQLGDWSEERLINVYASPTLDLSVTNNEDSEIDPDNPVTSFPIYVKGLAGPSSQVPIGYHVSVISNQMYETLDSVGNNKIVNEGEEIYSKFFDISDPLLVELSASNIDFADGCSYTLKCTVTMDTSLEAHASVNFDVAWTDEDRWPTAEITVDREALVAYIRPYCEGYRNEYREVIVNELSNGNTVYVLTEYEVEVPSDPTLIDCTLEKTTTGETIYSFVHAETGNTIRFCRFSYVKENDDVRLNVYRREFDGTFTELAVGINPNLNTHITDPHPALDYARYRVVAVQQGTGAVSYSDIAMVEVGEKAVIIQWDEDWSDFTTDAADELVERPWSGSLLRLPYNIDISDSYDTDKSLVKYIGREYPVSYYGTQLDSSSTWNVEIPKTDKETLYALRRLAIWKGDVYVREPSGSGYWANITVSFSQKHKELTIPITFNIKRVEGGA